MEQRKGHERKISFDFVERLASEMFERQNVGIIRSLQLLALLTVDHALLEFEYYVLCILFHITSIPFIFASLNFPQIRKRASSWQSSSLTNSEYYLVYLLLLRSREFPYSHGCTLLGFDATKGSRPIRCNDLFHENATQDTDSFQLHCPFSPKFLDVKGVERQELNGFG